MKSEYFYQERNRFVTSMQNMWNDTNNNNDNIIDDNIDDDYDNDEACRDLIDGLLQDCSNSIANALDRLQ